MSSGGLSLDRYEAVPAETHIARGKDENSRLQSQAEGDSSVSWARIYSLCIANFGINCAWALEFAITTPYFEKGLRSGKVISHAVWIVGPLSGLVVAPLVGTLSDRCTNRHGRRRPFILAGLIFTLIGMLMFANARQLAGLCYAEGTEQNRVTAIVIAILSFCILDLAINTTMWPVRALQGDIVPRHQQHSLQSASIVMFSFGDLAASGLVHSIEEPVSYIRSCFLAAGAVYLVTVASLLILGKETALAPDDPSIPYQMQSSMNIFSYLRSLPGWMWRVGGTHALGFFSLFCFLPNTTTWLGTTVLGGDPSAKPGTKKAENYEMGVTVYGKASQLRSVLQILYSAVYPWLLGYVTPGQLMGTSFGVFGIVLMALAGTNSLTLAEVVVVLMSFPIAAHFTLPVGLTVENSDASNRGRYLGALNCFAVIPQIIDTIYTGFVSRAFGEAWVMRIAAGWAIITGIFATFKMRVQSIPKPDVN